MRSETDQTQKMRTSSLVKLQISKNCQKSPTMPSRSDTSDSTRNNDTEGKTKTTQQSPPQDPRKCCVFLLIALAILVVIYLFIPFDDSMKFVLLFFGILPVVVLLINGGCYILRTCIRSNDTGSGNTERDEQSLFYVVCGVRRKRNDLELATNTWISNDCSSAQLRIQEETMSS